MTKEQFVEQFGRPFKESFFRDEHGVLHETLYYKEFMGRGMPSTRSSGSRIRYSWLRSRATRNALYSSGRLED